MMSTNRAMTSTNQADQVFAALADATRRDIVMRALSGREGVAELATHYPMSFAAVQKHVAVLERAGLITKERTGRRKVVRTDMEGLRLAQRLLDDYEALWRGRIDRMTDLITSARRSAHDRHVRPQGSRHADHDPDRGVRRLTRTRLGAMVRSAPARAVVGPAHLARHVHGPRPDPGSHVEYHMTGPTGEEAHGYWDVVEATPPSTLVFIDGFAGRTGHRMTASRETRAG